MIIDFIKDRLADIFRPIQFLLKEILPKFLLKEIFVKIYKVLPFCVLLFLNLNLKINLAGYILIGYLVYKIAYLLFIYGLYIWKVVLMKGPLSFVKIMNLVSLPFKVITSLGMIFILYSLL